MVDAVYSTIMLYAHHDFAAAGMGKRHQILSHIFAHLITQQRLFGLGSPSNADLNSRQSHFQKQYFRHNPLTLMDAAPNCR
jgi:hypothetical protein